MRTGPNIGYKSDNGNLKFVDLDEFLEYAEFQRESAIKQFSGEATEEAEVNQVDMTMNPADRARLVKDLAIEGITSDVTDFTDKVDMGDGVKMSWRGVIIGLGQYQLKIYNKK